jgi:tellurite resistance protein TerC
MLAAVAAVGWAATLALIGALLAFDLLSWGRRPHRVSYREAVAWSAFYITVAVLFGIALGLLAGWDLGGQYFAGYVVEKSLSIDNLFVFVIIMSRFAVPAELQPRALMIGVMLALALRTVFIALGAALIATFSFTFVIFGAVLIVTAIQLLRHRDEDPSVQDNALIELASRRLPFTDSYRDGRIVTRLDGRRVLTPLFLVLVAIGTTDVLFALDSIPAVYGVTQHAYIVFVANAFALLGLRALYFLVSGLLDRLVYLSTGLAVILLFIGAKLMLHFVHLQDHRVPEISTGVSLAVIVVVLLITTAASLIRVRRDPTIRAHAGSLRSPTRRERQAEQDPAA